MNMPHGVGVVRIEWQSEVRFAARSARSARPARSEATHETDLNIYINTPSDDIYGVVFGQFLLRLSAGVF